jgi:hypothetical protein
MDPKGPLSRYSATINLAEPDKIVDAAYPPSHISQTDGLRYKREYSVMRIGEDLPESINGNRGLEMLPWQLSQNSHSTAA